MYKLLDNVNFYSAEEIEQRFSNESAIAEKERALAAEKVLQENIDKEQARAEAAETAEKERATAEKERATAAEAEITGKVTAEKERATAAETKLTEDLAAETARATAAEQANTDAIQAEAIRASQEEGKISNSVIKETTRATKAESNITRHVFLVYDTQGELPTVQKDPNTSVTIYTGQLAYITGNKHYYSATVTDGNVTWELSAESPTISIDDTVISAGSVWSSQKTSTEISKNRIYSTDETDTGKIWIDGKNIYRKVIDCGALPNNTVKNVPIDITNLNKIIDLTITTTDIMTGETIQLPYAQIGGHVVEAYRQTNSIRLITTSDWSMYTETFAVLEYTKTTD